MLLESHTLATLLWVELRVSPPHPCTFSFPELSFAYTLWFKFYLTFLKPSFAVAHLSGSLVASTLLCFCSISTCVTASFWRMSWGFSASCSLFFKSVNFRVLLYSIIFNPERSKVVTFLTYHVEDIWIGAAVAPQNLPSWFRLMFHHEYHIALHSYIVMGSKYFGYKVFLKLWRLVALTSCSSRTLSFEPLDLSSSYLIAYLKMFHPSLWILRGFEFVFDYKRESLLWFTSQIRVLFDQG